MEREKNDESSTLTFNNRLGLTKQFKEQRNTISVNDFNELGSNFRTPASEPGADDSEPANGAQRFNEKWLIDNSFSTGLADKSEAKQKANEGRVGKKKPQGRVESADRKFGRVGGMAKRGGDLSRSGGGGFAGGAGMMAPMGSPENDEPAGKDPFSGENGRVIIAEGESELERYQKQLDVQSELSNASDQEESHPSGRAPSTAATRSPATPPALQPLELVRPQMQTSERGAQQAQTDPDSGYLASLDVDLTFGQAGVEYLFTAPRSEVTVTARAVTLNFYDRLTKLSLIFSVVIGIVALRRFAGWF